MHSGVSSHSEFFHDLRNFLFVVRGAAQEAALAFQRGELHADELLAIAEYAGRAAEIVDRIDRPAGAPAVTVASHCDLGDTVIAASTSLRHAATGATLCVQADQGCIVAVDCLSIERVLLNLVLNAREAGARNIGIAVTATELDPHWIDGPIPPHAPGWVRLTVEDDGRGMTMHEANHAAEPDFTTKSGGSGLGLALVHKLVEDNGGVLQIGSEPEEGTRVVCILPALGEDDPDEPSDPDELRS